MHEHASAPARARRARGHFLLPAVVAVVVVAVLNLRVIAHTELRQPPRFDAGWILSSALEMKRALAAGDVRGLRTAWTNAPRAPLYPALLGCGHALLGEARGVAYVVQQVLVLLLLGTCARLFRTAEHLPAGDAVPGAVSPPRIIRRGNPALWLCVASLPLTCFIARQPDPFLLVAVLVTVGAVALRAAEQEPSVSRGAAVGTLMGLSVLTKEGALVYWLGPLLGTAFQARRLGATRRRVVGFVAIAGATAGGIALTYFAGRVTDVAAYLASGGMSGEPQVQGANPSRGLSALYYPVVVAFGLLPLLAGWLLLPRGGSTVKDRGAQGAARPAAAAAGGDPAHTPRRDTVAAHADDPQYRRRFAYWWVIPPAVLFPFLPNKNWAFFVPLLPGFALLMERRFTPAALRRSPGRAAALLAVMVLSVVGATSTTVQARVARAYVHWFQPVLPFHPDDRLLAERLLDATVAGTVPELDWQVDTVLSTLASYVPPAQREPSAVIVFVTRHWFNPNTLRYEAVRGRLPLDIQWPDPRRLREQAAAAQFLVFEEAARDVGRSGAADDPSLADLLAPSGGFARMPGHYDLPGGGRILTFARQSPAPE